MAESDRTVVMLDVEPGMLHMPGDVHLHTACGMNLTRRTATVGPIFSVGAQADYRCPECFPRTIDGWTGEEHRDPIITVEGRVITRSDLERFAAEAEEG